MGLTPTASYGERDPYMWKCCWRLSPTPVPLHNIFSPVNLMTQLIFSSEPPQWQHPMGRNGKHGLWNRRGQLLRHKHVIEIFKGLCKTQLGVGSYLVVKFAPLKIRTQEAKILANSENFLAQLSTHYNVKVWESQSTIAEGVGRDVLAACKFLERH